MNSTYTVIWIIIFELYLLFSTSISEDTQQVNSEPVYMYSNETNVDEQYSIKYVTPVMITLSMLAVPVICAIAWLVYIKTLKKRPVYDVENPPVTEQTEKKSSEIPESSDSFFRRLWKRIRKKEKPRDIDVENPPEADQPEQESKAAIIFDRSLSDKCKRKKKKDTADITEKLPDITQTKQESKTAKRTVHKKIRRKKKKTEKADLPAAAQSEAGTESTDRREHSEKIETPTGKKLTEPESSGISTSKFLETLVFLPKKPSEKKKRKKVQRSIKIEEIINKEDNEGLLKQMKEIKSKLQTAHNVNISVYYEKIEDADSKEDDALSLKVELEPDSFQPQTSTSDIEKQPVILQPTENICGNAEDELLLQIELLLLLLTCIHKSAEPESEVQLNPIKPTENTCANEEDELLLQMELLLLLLTCIHKSAEPESEVQLNPIKPTENTCANEEDELLLQMELLLLLLTCVQKLVEPASELQLNDEKDDPSLQEKGKTPHQLEVYKSYSPEVKKQQRIKGCTFYGPEEEKAEVCKLYRPGKRLQQKAKVCKFYGPGKTIQRKGKAFKNDVKENGGK